jgi:hypothetical protein
MRVRLAMMGRVPFEEGNGLDILLVSADLRAFGAR